MPFTHLLLEIIYKKVLDLTRFKHIKEYHKTPETSWVRGKRDAFLCSVESLRSRERWLT